MKKITIKYLKEHLSEVAEQASKGVLFQITKYSQPYFKMMPWQEDTTARVGKYVGKRFTQPVLHNKLLLNTALQYLYEDREGRF